MYLKHLILLIGIVKMDFQILSCGHLSEPTYVCTGNRTDVRIQLTPSKDMETYIKVEKIHRWIHYFGPNYTEHRSISPRTNTSKYVVQDESLIIMNITKEDDGICKLDCFKNGTWICVTENEVAIKFVPCLDINSTYLPTQATTILTTDMLTAIPAIPEPFNEVSVFSSTVVAVIAVCSTIVVIVIAGTVVIVLRKQRTPSLATRRLVSHEGGSVKNIEKQIDNESVYNEIDPDMDYIKVQHKAFDSSKLTLLTLEQSPSLPRRPDQEQRKASHTENDYATLKDDALDSSSTFVKERKNSANKEMSQTETNIPEYTKVNKVKKSKKETKQEVTTSMTENKTEYSVVFPYINCSELLKTCPNQTTVTLRKDDEVKYSNLGNLVTRNRRSKVNQETSLRSQASDGLKLRPVDLSGLHSEFCDLRPWNRRSKARASRKELLELQYAILDHSGSQLSISSRENEMGTSNACPYASIDFEKKAFVAPIRKAPSSWYKRRNKDKNVTGI